MSRFNDIRQWAEARNLIDGSTPHKQLGKLTEEIGELAHGINKGRMDEIVDGIGDAVVVLTILAAQHGVHIEDCIDLAWMTIKDRTGRMIDGVWVKDEDINDQLNATVEAANATGTGRG